jgi:hypothetical protein
MICETVWSICPTRDGPGQKTGRSGRSAILLFLAFVILSCVPFSARFLPFCLRHVFCRALACNASWSFSTVDGVGRLIANLLVVAPSCVFLELRSLPSSVISGFGGTMDLSDFSGGPACALAGVRLGHAPTAGDLPCCVVPPCADMPSPLPRWERKIDKVAPAGPCIVGLPHPFAGSAPTTLVSRPARRSLVLRPACSRSRPWRPFASEASVSSLPPSPPRLLPAGANQLPGGNCTH